MKHYAVIDWTNGDRYETIFDTELEALESAENQWNHLTKPEKQNREFFAIMFGDLDEDECFDINSAEIIKEYKFS